MVVLELTYYRMKIDSFTLFLPFCTQNSATNSSISFVSTNVKHALKIDSNWLAEKKFNPRQIAIFCIWGPVIHERVTGFRLDSVFPGKRSCKLVNGESNRRKERVARKTQSREREFRQRVRISIANNNR